MRDPVALKQVIAQNLCQGVISGGAAAVFGLKQQSAKQFLGGAGPLGAAGNEAISSNFTTVGSYNLQQVRNNFGRFTGTVGLLTCHIMARSGTQATGVPTGATLASSTNTIDISTLQNIGYPFGNTPVTFLFTGLQLAAATGYCHVYTISATTGLGWSALCDNTLNISQVSKATTVAGPWTLYFANYQIEFENWGT